MLLGYHVTCMASMGIGFSCWKFFSLVPFFLLLACKALVWLVTIYLAQGLEVFSFVGFCLFILRLPYLGFRHLFFSTLYLARCVFFRSFRQAQLTLLSEVELLVLESVLVFESFFFLWSFLNRCLFVLFFTVVFIF